MLTPSNIGLVLHSEAHGWGAFVVRPLTGGVAACLFQDTPDVQILGEYREIDYITDGIRIRVSESVLASVLVDDYAIDAEVRRDLREQLEVLDLPDLNALARTWREEEARQIGAAVATVTGEIDETRDQIMSLTSDRNDHPYHDSARRKDQARSIKQRDELAQERNNLTDVLNREIEAEELRVRRIIHGIREVLHRFTFMRRGFPTEKADMLADIFDNDGLILCELVDRNILNDLDPGELAEFFSWFSFD